MQTQHRFISLIPDANSIAQLKEQIAIVSDNSGLVNKTANQFLHLTILDLSFEQINDNPDTFKSFKLLQDLDVEVKFELLKHNKNKYIYCAIPNDITLIKSMRTGLKLSLQKKNPTIELNNSGTFMPHITLINNINPYQKFLISKQIENNQKNILIKFKEVSIYHNNTRHSENIKFDIPI